MNKQIIISKVVGDDLKVMAPLKRKLDAAPDMNKYICAINHLLTYVDCSAVWDGTVSLK